MVGYGCASVPCSLARLNLAMKSMNSIIQYLSSFKSEVEKECLHPVLPGSVQDSDQSNSGEKPTCQRNFIQVGP